MNSSSEQQTTTPPEQVQQTQARVHRNGQQDTASPEEARQRAEELRTAGRKGCKAPRINLALTFSNYDFIRTLAAAKGQTMTGLINQLIADYRQDHPEIMQAAADFLQQISQAAGQVGACPTISTGAGTDPATGSGDTTEGR